MGQVTSPAGVRVALSTASVYPERAPDAFEIAARLGYDGVEVMVTMDPVSQDLDVLRRLSDYHGVPVLAVHAPCLMVTQRVWGTRALGQAGPRQGGGGEARRAASSWCTRRFAGSASTPGTSGGHPSMAGETDVRFAVENMYPLRGAAGRRGDPYAPDWNPVEIDCPHATLDLSHTAVSGSDAMDMADELGSRLAHVHIADGTAPGLPDEHLVPGRGTQPCAELLASLGSRGYSGMVVLEVNTRRAQTSEERRAELAESLAFTRQHLGAALHPGSA